MMWLNGWCELVKGLSIIRHFQELDQDYTSNSRTQQEEENQMETHFKNTNQETHGKSISRTWTKYNIYK